MVKNNNFSCSKPLDSNIEIIFFISLKSRKNCFILICAVPVGLKQMALSANEKGEFEPFVWPPELPNFPKSSQNNFK